MAASSSNPRFSVVVVVTVSASVARLVKNMLVASSALKDIPLDMLHGRVRNDLRISTLLSAAFLHDSLERDGTGLNLDLNIGDDDQQGMRHQIHL